MNPTITDIRATLRARNLVDETPLVRDLIAATGLDDAARHAISAHAETLVTTVRSGNRLGLMESFLAEYGLATDEGVALMSLAEALLRELGGPGFEVASAGTQVTRVHPLANQTMAAAGIDITDHRSKHLDEFAGQRFDILITVCDDAAEAGPVFPGAAQRLHWSIPDPSAVEGSDRERAQAFASAADLLRERVARLIQNIEA